MLTQSQQITWLLNNNSNESKRGAGLAVLAIFGQCSSFLSSAVFPDADAYAFIRLFTALSSYADLLAAHSSLWGTLSAAASPVASGS